MVEIAFHRMTDIPLGTGAVKEIIRIHGLGLFFWDFCVCELKEKLLSEVHLSVHRGAFLTTIRLTYIRICVNDAGVTPLLAPLMKAASYKNIVVDYRSLFLWTHRESNATRSVPCLDSLFAKTLQRMLKQASPAGRKHPMLSFVKLEDSFGLTGSRTRDSSMRMTRNTTLL